MVDGAAYYLVCHDDVALFPTPSPSWSKRRSVPTPGGVAQVVSWDDTERLIHVA